MELTSVSLPTIIDHGVAAAEVNEHLVGLSIESVEVADGILVEQGQVIAMMVVSDRETEAGPEPLGGMASGS